MASNMTSVLFSTSLLDTSHLSTWDVEATRNGLKLLARNADNSGPKIHPGGRCSKDNTSLSLKRRKPWILATLAFAPAHGHEWARCCALCTLGQAFWKAGVMLKITTSSGLEQ